MHATPGSINELHPQFQTPFTAVCVLSLLLCRSSYVISPVTVEVWISFIDHSVQWSTACLTKTIFSLFYSKYYYSGAYRNFVLQNWLTRAIYLYTHILAPISQF